MIRHILKMLWNQQRSFAGIFIEQVLVFIVLMLCAVSVADKIREYNTPGMLDTQGTMLFGYMFRNDQPRTRQEGEQVLQQMNTVAANLRNDPSVVAITKSRSLLPYLQAGDEYMSDSITIDRRTIKIWIKGSDAGAEAVLRPQIAEGTWMDARKLADDTYPAVVSRQFVDELGWGNAVGKKFQYHSVTYTIVGVVSGVKQNVFAESPSVLIIPAEVMDGWGMLTAAEYCVRVRPAEQDAFSAAYFKEFRKIITDPKVEPVIMDMDRLKNQEIIWVIAGLVFQTIPTVFFLVFGFIGTFGLFWLYSRKRVREFALRRAVGATKVRLVRMVVAESVVLTLLAAVPGLLLAAFIYTWDWTVVAGVGSTLAIMLIFSVFSAWYPAWKVSRVSPAEALHNE